MSQPWENRVSLFNDVIGVIALYTVPSVTYSLLSLNEYIALVAYQPGLWRNKVVYERRGVLLDDSVVVPPDDPESALGRWHLYYRIINEREFGIAALILGPDRHQNIIYGATNISINSVDSISVSTPFWSYQYKYDLWAGDTITETKRLKFSSRCLKTNLAKYLLENGTVVLSDGTVIARDAVDLVVGRILMRDRTIVDDPISKDVVHILDTTDYTRSDGSIGPGSYEKNIGADIVLRSRNISFKSYFDLEINVDGQVVSEARQYETEAPVIRAFVMPRDQGFGGDAVLDLNGTIAYLGADQSPLTGIPPIKLLSGKYFRVPEAIPNYVSVVGIIY